MPVRVAQAPLPSAVAFCSVSQWGSEGAAGALLQLSLSGGDKGDGGAAAWTPVTASAGGGPGSLGAGSRFSLLTAAPSPQGS